MATLQGRAIKDTYKDLLQVSNGNAGVDATIRTVEDGEGTQSALQLSTGGINVSGNIDMADGSKFNGLYEVKPETSNTNHRTHHFGTDIGFTRTGPSGYPVLDTSDTSGSDYQFNCDNDSNGTSSLSVKGSADNVHFLLIENMSTSGVETGIALRGLEDSNTTSSAINMMMQQPYKRYVTQFLHGGMSGTMMYNADSLDSEGSSFSPAFNVGQDINSIIVTGSDLGQAALRWKNIYAANATILTSDRNKKTEITDLSDAEKRVAVALKGLVKKFKFKAAVANKGDKARFHVGVIAQDVQEAFAAEGLDATDYSLFCIEKWYEYADETTEVGGIVVSKDPVEGKDCVEKTQLGVRYEEILGFIISAL